MHVDICLHRNELFAAITLASVDILKLGHTVTPLTCVRDSVHHSSLCPVNTSLSVNVMLRWNFVRRSDVVQCTVHNAVYRPPRACCVCLSLWLAAVLSTEALMCTAIIDNSCTQLFQHQTSSLLCYYYYYYYYYKYISVFMTLVYGINLLFHVASLLTTVSFTFIPFHPLHYHHLPPVAHPLIRSKNAPHYTLLTRLHSSHWLHGLSDFFSFLCFSFIPIYSVLFLVSSGRLSRLLISYVCRIMLYSVA